MAKVRSLRGAATGKADMQAELLELIDRCERGELSCLAPRLFRPDGTWEDIAIGGTAKERAQALVDLRATHQAN